MGNQASSFLDKNKVIDDRQAYQKIAVDEIIMPSRDQRYDRNAKLDKKNKK
ncbi:hypothetical protein CRENPOLYSF2_2340009 [Crenothrix polyspora]|uniref:Uncharacterized protein n=1 Tax=Crenothrix polyspora TaxID=360316 RepID=A0A1R4H765_9GAMM|nr:hypothetical protein [Crenothrix polyspora]SJM91690.1 hypothetical protein CRENPOLYSF2_2340009 [Crenothrix polyspora]